MLTGVFTAERLSRRSRRKRLSGARRAAAFLLAAACGVWGPAAFAGERETSAASAFMERGLFADAIKLLEGALAEQGDDGSAAELRMLGECHHQAGDYGKSRTFYARALPRQTSQKARMICESRLAILDYRLGDLRGAAERIENYVRKYPNDGRVGNMMVLGIRIVQDSPIPRAEKIAQIEAQYQKIAADKERYGYYNAVLAAQTLGDMYIEAGEEQKAVSLFVTAVHEMRALMAAEKAAGRAVPSDLAQGVDAMSLQIGKFYVARKDWSEAEKWLYNVSYSEAMTAQAKYLLAQIAYQNRRFADAIYLLSEDVLAKLPEGETRYAIYLLIGFCHRDALAPNLESAKESLKKIPRASAAYGQAQLGLGDIYRDQKDAAKAEPHYLEAAKDPRFAAAALYSLGVIMKEAADASAGPSDADRRKREELLKKAGRHFQELLLKYPLTDLAKQAKPIVEALQALGVTVAAESSGEERIAAWNKVVEEKPRSNEAAQALLSLAQYHGRAVHDSRTRAVVKAPDWDACAKACLPIVKSPAPFANVSAERWREIRVRALYLLACAELGSLPAGASARRLRGHVEPVRMPGGGSTGRAIGYLTEAESLLAGQDAPDDARDVEYALIEAMLKSDDKAVREQGEKRYAEREPRYGNDPDFQRLAVVTADWLDANGFHEMAGRTYRSVAYKATADREQVMHLLHLAGVSYGRAGRALIESRDHAATIAFLFEPRSVIRTAAAEPVLQTHPLFRLTKRILWEQEGPDLSAAGALERVSREFGVPLVWSPEDTPGSVAEYLRQKTVPRATLRNWRATVSLAEMLTSIVDTNRFDVDLDLGVSGGTPTLKPAKPDESGGEEVPAIEIFPRHRERFAPLARMYGSFASAHGGPTMLFNIVGRLESITGGRVLWAEGVPKDEALSREFRELPGIPADRNVTCRQVLDAALEAVGLKYRVVARDQGRELITESIECFDELRKFGADSVYAEDAMFNIAVNLYVLKDYGRMRLLLREYLKTYDNPSFVHYYDACYWLGRLFEIDRNFREAAKYYTRASEEKVVLYRPAAGAGIPSLQDIQGRLSYETLFNLSRKGSGMFKDARLDREFLSFIRFHTNVEIGLDPSARGIELPIAREPFVAVPCIELLHDVMVALGLDLRTENGDKEVAEKAYYRLAVVYKEDNLMREAVENVQTLLTRFPRTERLVDALKLKLDIYKGLREYGPVLATLEELKASAAGKVEPFILDYEKGRVLFDLCDYTNAAACFEKSLSGTQAPEEWVRIREALAQTYLRMGGRERDALDLYRQSLQYETSPLRQSIYAMMIHWLDFATRRPPREPQPLPANEAEFIRAYEGVSDAERARMDANDLARATWIYYALAMEDLVATNTAAALVKLDAAGASPDAFLAGEALYQSALIHIERSDYRKARECLEHLLFTTKAVEPTVKATYELARCLKAIGDQGAAARRLEELVVRYPGSPCAALARQDPLYAPNAGDAASP